MLCVRNAGNDDVQRAQTSQRKILDTNEASGTEECFETATLNDKAGRLLMQGSAIKTGIMSLFSTQDVIKKACDRGT